MFSENNGQLFPQIVCLIYMTSAKNQHQITWSMSGYIAKYKWFNICLNPYCVLRILGTHNYQPNQNKDFVSG